MQFLRVTVMLESLEWPRIINVAYIRQVLPQSDGGVRIDVEGSGTVKLGSSWTMARLEAALPMVVEAPGAASAAADAAGGAVVPAPRGRSPRGGRR